VRNAVVLALVAGGLVAGYVAGSHGDRARSVTTPAVVAAHGATETRIIHTGADESELRAMIRDELARAPAVRAAPPEPEPSAQAQAAFETARSLVASRIDAGSWREADRDALRSAIATLSHDQFEQIMSSLFPALNDGRLKLTFRGAAV